MQLVLLGAWGAISGVQYHGLGAAPGRACPDLGFLVLWKILPAACYLSMIFSFA